MEKENVLERLSMVLFFIMHKPFILLGVCPLIIFSVKDMNSEAEVHLSVSPQGGGLVCFRAWLKAPSACSSTPKWHWGKFWPSLFLVDLQSCISLFLLCPLALTLCALFTGHGRQSKERWVALCTKYPVEDNPFCSLIVFLQCHNSQFRTVKFKCTNSSCTVHLFFFFSSQSGRSEPNSVPLLLLFQGGRCCEPLEQQEETAGGRYRSHAYL